MKLRDQEFFTKESWMKFAKNQVKMKPKDQGSSKDHKQNFPKDQVRMKPKD